MTISSIRINSDLSLDQRLAHLRTSESTVLAAIQSKRILAQNRLLSYRKIRSATTALKSASDALSAAETLGSPESSASDSPVKTFIAAYNNLQATIKSLTAYSADTNSSSPLTGDSLACRVQNQVRAALNVATSSGPIRSLSQLGIRIQASDGTLMVDETKLSAAFQYHRADAQDLFSGETGVSAQLSTVANNFLSTSGVFSTATDGIKRLIADLQQQYDAASERIDAKMDAYHQKFADAGPMIAQMASVSGYLTRPLSMPGGQRVGKTA